ncbi:hypothetical protein VNI00_003517 [Paramarasmius palmivorus]|uniref:NAD(P)-binding protein n=1 Tax=Paramarasmius palmivorus TaxID=297713 RepID=A0AAW0DRN9_9AGAR
MFGNSTRFNPETDIVDLTGKIVIVTGSNRGIGYATVQHFAQAGAKVYMATRDEQRAERAIESLRRLGSKGEVFWLKLDLSDPKEAKAAAEEFLSKEQRLDILEVLNNMDRLFSPFEKFEKTSEGPSRIVTVNYISPFVFTETLLPLLVSTARSPASDVRILSSTAHRSVPLPVKFEDVEDFCVEYNGHFFPSFSRYAHTKLLSVLWTAHLQKRLDSLDLATPILVIAVHPGKVDTVTPNWPLPQVWGFFSRITSDDAEHGSYTTVFAAASRVIESERIKYKGAYLEHKPVGNIVRPLSLAEDETLAQNLFVLTTKFLNKI